MRLYPKKTPLKPFRKRRRGMGRHYKGRFLIVFIILGIAYAAIFARLGYLGLQAPPPSVMSLMQPSYARPNIVDRNGVVLAMDIPAASIFAEPRKLLDVDETVEGLISVFPELNIQDLYKRLDSDRGFVWIKRQVSVETRNRVWNLGLPAVAYREETQRLYPNGTLAAHILGSVNTDNVGIAGMEKWIDGQGLQELRNAGLSPDSSALEPVALSVDLRAQFTLTDELRKAVEKFSAIAAAGLIMDVTNGEIIALASLPDFNPNIPIDALKPDRINRINVGTYEMGSTFKAMTTAMALDSGVFNLASVLDASQPLRFGRMAIRDYRGQNRPLNIPEAFIHSSNIAMGRMALGVGSEKHQDFLRVLGQLERLTTELPENAMPILPARWGDITTVTASFGHGIAVTPLQAAMGIASLVNGGDLIRPTLVKGASLAPRIIRRGVVSAQTGEALRFLMRLNAEIGSAKKADVPGYFIGGKTGTSEKVVNGTYSSDRVLTAFMGVAPANNPRYLFLTILDEPKPLPETYGFRTSGWNAVPVTGTIMTRVLPLLLGSPTWAPPNDPFPNIVAQNAWGSQYFTGTYNPSDFLVENF